MKIDLSKYSPGTKFQQRNKSKTPMILVGINPINHKYVVTWQSPVTRKTQYQEYNQDGSLSEVGHLCPEHDLVELYPSDKYLVSFCRKDGTVGTTVVTNPTEFTPEYFLLMCLRNESVFGLFDIGKSIPDKVLSWSKIEE